MPEWSQLERWRKQAEPGYKRATTYYNSLRAAFIQQAKSVQKEVVDNAAVEFLNEINEQLIKEQGQFFNQNGLDMEKLYDAIAEFVERNISNKTDLGVLFQQAETKFKDIVRDTRSGSKLDTYLNKIKEQSKQDLILSYEQNDKVKIAINQIFSRFFSNGTPSTASRQGMFGMLRRAILERAGSNEQLGKQIRESKRMNGYKQLFRGYYSEVIKTKVLDGALQSFQSVQAGDTPDNSGKLSKYDIVLFKNGNNNPLSDIISSMDNLNQGFILDAKIPLSNPDDMRQGFGVQSKLWTLPEELERAGKKLDSQFYSIGHRADLFNSLDGLNNMGDSNNYDPSWKRGWSHNIYQLSRYLISVFGQSQVIFGLKNQFIWTSDLISSMRSKGYWVSFYYSRNEGEFIYPATTEVVWDRSRLGYKAHMEAKARAKAKKNKS